MKTKEDLSLVKRVILIPKMYEKKDLEKILGKVPDDFEEVYSEFWDYIEEKLAPFIERVQAVYYETPVSRNEGESRIEAIFRKFEGHAEFYCVEDPLLAAEAEAWREMMQNEGNQAILELLEESIKDRNNHVSDILDKTLENGRLGILFFDPEKKYFFPESINVVRMYPFDPCDYLRRQLAKRNLGNQWNKSAS